MKKLLIAGLLVLAAQFDMSAQKDAPKSPKMTAEGKNVKVTYGQPSKRGRVIFGELVPYGQVWRTGANEATEITFSKNVTINNKEIKAGTYTLFSIPEKDKWMIVLNSELKQWGAYDYEKIKAKNVVSTDVMVKKIASQEKLTYSFKDNASGTVLVIAWDEAEVALPISIK